MAARRKAMACRRRGLPAENHQGPRETEPAVAQPRVSKLSAKGLERTSSAHDKDSPIKAIPLRHPTRSRPSTGAGDRRIPARSSTRCRRASARARPGEEGKWWRRTCALVIPSIAQENTPTRRPASFLDLIQEGQPSGLMEGGRQIFEYRPRLQSSRLTRTMVEFRAGDPRDFDRRPGRAPIRIFRVHMIGDDQQDRTPPRGRCCTRSAESRRRRKLAEKLAIAFWNKRCARFLKIAKEADPRSKTRDRRRGGIRILGEFHSRTRNAILPIDRPRSSRTCARPTTPAWPPPRYLRRASGARAAACRFGIGMNTGPTTLEEVGAAVLGDAARAHSVRSEAKALREAEASEARSRKAAELSSTTNNLSPLIPSRAARRRRSLERVWRPWSVRLPTIAYLLRHLRRDPDVLE